MDSLKLLDEKMTSIKKLLGEISVIARNIENEKNNTKIVKTKRTDKVLEGTDELALFMNLEAQNKKVTRNSVLKFIANYAKVNNLQNLDNKREFFTDEVLSNLLHIELNTKITFLSINKYISHLFVKK